MSYQSGFFSSAPVNFNRFLEMTRSSSRSLSPERELKQMTVPGQRPPRGAPKATTSRHGTRATPETAASPAAGTSTRQVHVGSGGGSDSRSTSAAGAAMTLATASALTSSSDSGNRQHYEHGGVFVSNVDTDGERSNSTSTDVFSAALQWQYGSPLYYPVTDGFYCWNGHTLTPKRRGEYGQLEGVSCDFCGFTHWLKKDEAPQADSPAKADKSSSRSRRKTQTAPKAAKQEAPEAVPEASPTLTETIFYHCDSCGVDLCPQCLDEVRADERYHVPCMKCLKCFAYVPLQKAAAHRCPSSTATTAVTASQTTTLVMDTLKPEERGTLLKLELRPPSAAPVKVEADAVVEREELDLLGPALVASKASPLFDRRAASSLPRHADRGRGGRPRTTSLAEDSALSTTSRGSPRRKAVKMETEPPSAPSVSAAPAVATPARGLWVMQVATRSAAERAEALRLAEDLHLAAPEEAPRKRSLRFRLPTRLAAERCAERARDFGLDATVERDS